MGRFLHVVVLSGILALALGGGCSGAGSACRQCQCPRCGGGMSPHPVVGAERGAPDGVLLEAAKASALAFFDACARGNRDDMRRVTWLGGFGEARPEDEGLLDRLLESCDGVRVEMVGTPFQRDRYPGLFVPYEVVLKDGSRKVHQLAVRNDFGDQTWRMDGGW